MKGGKEEKKKRKKKRSQASQGMELWIFVWKLTFIMNSMTFGMDIWFCMIIILPKPRVLLGFHPKTIKYGK